MRNESRASNFVTRFALVATIAVAGIITIVGSNGGGGDGDGDAGSDLLGSYDIRIARGVDGAGDTTNGITVAVDLDGATASLRLDPNPVLGQYMCDQTTEICELSRINPGTFLYLYDGSATQVVGDLIIQIPEQVIISTIGQPIIGRVQIQSVAAPNGLDAGFIDVDLDTCPDVEIVDNGASLGCYTWDEFEALFDDPAASQAEQLASFGFQALGFLFEQVDLVTEVLGLIDEYEADLRQAGTITEMCDAFADAGLAAPTGTVNQGMRTLSWIDTNSDGQVGPADDFVGMLDECWVNDPTDDIDEILDGTGNFFDYVLNEDPDREVITAIGFTSVAPSTPGGVVYSGFTISETEETTPGTAEIIDVIGLSGGVSVLFTE